MKCHVYDSSGETLLCVKESEPVCGEDFCDKCGDCLHCYGCDPCVGRDADPYAQDEEHLWVKYDAEDK